jgi:hypothetical protein
MASDSTPETASPRRPSLVQTVKATDTIGTIIDTDSDREE